MKRRIINIMLADSHPLCLYGLKHIIQSQDNLSVISAVSKGFDIIEQGLLLNPDILIIDPKLNDGDGFNCIRILKERGFKSKIILLLESICSEKYLQASKINIEGYILKTTELDKLLYSIKEVNRGVMFIDENIEKELKYSDECINISKIENQKLNELSQREFEILRLVSSGLRNKTIAEQLYISEKTVKNHLTRIFKKIEVNDRVQATLFAIKTGMI
ncbi:MAG: response regulator transcription factor [Gudongella sp.]|nr:response regulator transcription factor [Gudongella sp.]